MIYHSELFYFQDEKDFPLKKALLVTAKAVSAFCYDYHAKLVAPKKGVKDKIKQGVLPKEKIQREKLIEKIFDWIVENSDRGCSDLFTLFLYGKERNIKQDECEKFDHGDTTPSWALNLTDEEFATVQEEWQKNNLPKDLFYNRDLGIQKGWRYYTPKQWEAMNK